MLVGVRLLSLGAVAAPAPSYVGLLVVPFGWRAFPSEGGDATLDILAP